MNETATSQHEPTDDTALKRRLLGRIAVAAVVMVALLGSLAIFDALNAPAPVASKLAALPAPAAALAPGPAEPARPEAAPAATPAEAADRAAAAPVVAEGTASPGAPPLQPLPAEKPLTRPATGKAAALRPSEPALPALAPAARPEPARELTQRAPASRPVSQAAERRFALQMGVFSNVANAEDLRAKLEMNGIPASIEARVHVGPFATREEAEAARARLKELGLEGGLLLTMKARPQ